LAQDDFPAITVIAEEVKEYDLTEQDAANSTQYNIPAEASR
jgi:hypothetical protein